MIEKLEVKHLAPYLPYKLKMQVDLTKTIFKLEGISARGYLQVDGDLDISSFGYCKPVFHSLSKFGESDDLRKIHEFIGIGKWCEAYDNYFAIWFDDAANIDKLILQAPQEIFNYFIANHYDVFGLIDAGLAIDVNTVAV